MNNLILKIFLFVILIGLAVYNIFWLNTLLANTVGILLAMAAGSYFDKHIYDTEKLLKVELFNKK